VKDAADQPTTAALQTPKAALPASPLYAWFVVAVLSIADVVGYIDRQIINLLVEPIKADLGLTDTQISLLQGFSFALFYAILAVPLARLSDVGNRKQVIAAGVVVWTLATFSCGLAGAYVALFLARVLVGVGEATLTPGGYSLLSDYFPKDKLSQAVSVFTGSSFLGSGLAFIVGGAIISVFTEWGPVQLPLIGEAKPWQLTFMAVSLPGLLVFGLMLLIREPPRRGTLHAGAGPKPASAPAPSLSDAIAYLRGHARAYAAIVFGLTFIASANFGIGAWTPSFFIRTYGWTPAQVGASFGTMVMLLSVSGVVSGGWINDYLLKRGVVDSNLRMPMFAGAIALPFAIAFPLANSPILSLVLLAPVLFFGAMPFGAGTATLPMVTPNQMRAQVVALYLLIANLIGYALGPTLIALITDYGFGDPNKIRYALALGPSLILTGGVVTLAAGLKPFRALLAERGS